MEHEFFSTIALVMVGEDCMLLPAKHSHSKKEYRSREGKGKGARPRDGGAAEQETVAAESVQQADVAAKEEGAEQGAEAAGEELHCQASQTSFSQRASRLSSSLFPFPSLDEQFGRSLEIPL